ncbi:MAG TPA: hypothetical protein PKA37_13805, partial [Planctomycetota bacterium]|nr:hypothetical protein [Planctomycetota bacterium]
NIFPTTSGGIGVGITFSNLVISADVTGVIFGIPYNETATISAASATTSTSIVISSDAQGVTSVTTQGTNTTFNNFQFLVTGVLGGLTQLGAIQSAAQGAIVLALNGLAELIPTALNPLLSSFALNVDLSAAGIPVVVGLPIAGVNYDANGLTIGNRVSVTPLVQGSESPVLTQVFASPSALPAFGATTPVAAGAFTFAQSINDDLLNQFLAGLTATGALDINWTDLLGTSLDAALAASILPGAGFEALAPTTPVRAEVRHTVAPVTTFAGPGAVGTLRVCNLRLTFKAEVAPGVWADIARYGASSESSLTIGIDPVSGALTTIAGTPTIAVTLSGFLPGYDGAASAAGAVSIVQSVIPLITAPFSSIPLPGTGLGGGLLQEISVNPGTPDNLTIYFGL